MPQVYSPLLFSGHQFSIYSNAFKKETLCTSKKKKKKVDAVRHWIKGRQVVEGRQELGLWQKAGRDRLSWGERLAGHWKEMRSGLDEAQKSKILFWEWEKKLSQKPEGREKNIK